MEKGQFKTPFKQIKSEACVFTCKDTAVIAAGSDTRYSFPPLALRAGPSAPSVPTVD